MALGHSRLINVHITLKHWSVYTNNMWSGKFQCNYTFYKITLIQLKIHHYY